MRSLSAGAVLVALLSGVSPLCCYAAEAQPQELHILRVTPEGENVPATRQIVIEYNRPVVAVGKMDRTAAEVGVTITPAINCQWRWLNTSSLACQLDEKDELHRATKYQLHIEPRVTATDGGKLTAPFDSTFTTSLPEKSYTDFQTWKGPSSPVIRLVFNQPVAKTSVEKTITFRDKISGKDYAVKVAADDNDHDAPRLVSIPGEKHWLGFAHFFRKNDNQTTMVGGVEARRVWILEPKEILPENADIALHAEPGLISAEGPERSTKSDDITNFRTFPSAQFLGVRCSDNNNNELWIAPTDTGADKLCNPMNSVALRFATPTMRSMVKNHVRFSPDLAGGLKDYNPWGDEDRDYSRLDRPYAQDAYYDIWLPVGLKAAQTYTIDILSKKTGFIQTMMEKISKKESAGVADEFGRGLASDIHMTFQTNHRAPNYEMVYNNALLEKGVDSEVPLYVNNLKATDFNYMSVVAGGDGESATLHRDLPHVEDIQFGVPLGVRGILNGKSGAIYGHLGTTPPTSKSPESGRLFAQVTPFQVGLKLGHFSSLVWVMDLKTGLPVAGANVAVVANSFTDIQKSGTSLATAVTDENGIAKLPGADVMDPQKELRRYWKDEDQHLFVKVEKGEDMALLPAVNFFEVESSRVTDYKVYPTIEKLHGHMKAWGMTAQGIYHAGDKIQYKIYVRDQSDAGFIAAKSGPYKLDITDPMGNVVDTVADIQLDKFGTYSGEYAVPKSAAVGWYNFDLQTQFDKKSESKDSADNGDAGQDDNGDGSKEQKLSPLRVLVSDFTPAPFHVSNDVKGQHFEAGDKMEVSTLAQLHSGGPYSDAAVRVTATLNAQPFQSKNKAAEGFQFDSFKDEESSKDIFQKTDKLNDKGAWATTIDIPDTKIVYGTLRVESAVQDDRGKSVAGSTDVSFAGVNRLVGLKSTKWVFEKGKPATIETLVVDGKGEPTAGVDITADVEHEDVVTAKVKGAGNAYLSDVTTTWNKVGDCKIKSGVDALPCNFTPKMSGSYRVTAHVKDTKGHDHQTQMNLWVTGSDYVQWDDQNADYTLPMIPEKTEWNVGETVRYLIKNPYPGAKALVTIERYGVIDSYVTTLEGSTPILSIPIKPDYVPGFYVSVTVISPRVAGELPKLGQVDMGKPGFRMGYAAVTVKDPYKEIGVKVSPEAEVYRPRDKVTVKLTAAPKHPFSKPEDMELAVAVLDDSVFDLIGAGRAAFDPYQGFYHLDNLDVQNYSLLSALVGRQKFEKKGANAGGDGGADLGMRDLFKFVSYWNPSVKLDAKGEATISFDAPDNLTGWRVLALATTPTDRMGLGEGTFKVNRPTEVRPLMPNQVREGDHFNASFSVMNRTEKPRTLDVNIEASGDVLGGKTVTKTEKITLESYKRANVTVPVDVALLPLTRDVPEGAIHFKVTAADASDSDATVHDVPVLKARTIEVGANYATTTEPKAEEQVDIPKDIYTDIGDISVVLSPTVLGNLEGAFRYLRDYSYNCWEQQMTRAVMAAHYLSLKPWMSDKFAWKGADKITQETLDNAGSYQAPNGGMAYFVATDDRADPYLSAYTAMSFRWMTKAGYHVPEDVAANLDDYLLNFLRQDAAPDFYQKGMSSTVRAVALSALATSGKVGKDDITRYQPAVAEMSLFGKALFMDAAVTLKMPDVAKDVATKIFASANETGGKFMFQETYDDGYARILGTPLRDNCEILSAFSHFAELPEGRALIGDKPFKLVRAITESRGNRDHWENTQENMFCMNALSDYAHAYEKEKPSMTVTAKLDAQEIGKASFHDYKDAPQTITSDLKEGDAGRSTTLHLEREGAGRYYYSTRLRYAPKAAPENVNSGFDLHREYSVKSAGANGTWSILKDPVTLKRGDVVRVDLFVSVPAARNFVVVNDPLPGGFEVINRDLKTASGVDDAAAKFDQAGGSWWFKFGDWAEYDASFWNFYHKELRNDSARFYADYLPAGHYHLSYAAQVIADGTFTVLPTKVEEMYNPDVYGIGNKGTLHVDTAKAP